MSELKLEIIEGGGTSRVVEEIEVVEITDLSKEEQVTNIIGVVVKAGIIVSTEEEQVREVGGLVERKGMIELVKEVEAEEAESK